MSTPSSSRSGRTPRRTTRRTAAGAGTSSAPEPDVAPGTVEVITEVAASLPVAEGESELEDPSFADMAPTLEPLPVLEAIAPASTDSVEVDLDPLPEPSSELPPHEVVMAPSPDSTLATVQSGQTFEDVQGIPLLLREDKRLPNGHGRPVEISRFGTYQTFGSLSVRRPILNTHVEVVAMDEGRPVMANDFQIAEMINDAGARPIMVSSLKIDRIVGNFGARPVASNQIDPPNSDLMGYLD
jgi:hypothetical protein